MVVVGLTGPTSDPGADTHVLREFASILCAVFFLSLLFLSLCLLLLFLFLARQCDEHFG